MDTGPQTLAVWSQSEVVVDGAQELQDEIAAINAAMNRFLKAINPGMFDPDVQIIRIDRL